jgi:iron complex outermembrane receptor protein
MHLLHVRKPKHWNLLLAAFFLCPALFAQQAPIPVKGKVSDDTGLPLPNVTVAIKGSRTATVTGADGVFSINVPNAKSTLVFSYVGFQPQEAVVGDQASFDIKLATMGSKLNDVVVVGYGTQKRREITSAVATVSAEQFNKGNISDVSQLLQGKVAGLSIAKPGGDPNGGFNIRLRGLSTLGASTSPLVVVDGQIGIDINTIDPNDIQSIDVLKDAASAAIYGTRGSAGVIIVTTKRGTRGGGPSVAYNGTATAEKASKFTPHMSAAEYKAAGGADLKSNTDWNKAITRTALSHTHNISLSGGGNGTSYTASVNYRNEEGVAIRTGFNQLNGHLGLTQKALKDKLVFTLDMSNTKRNAQFGWSDAFKYATIFNPTAPIHSTDPNYDITGGGYFEQNFVDYANPVAVLEQNTNSRVTKRNNFNGTATYEIIKGLKFSVRYAQENVGAYNWAYLPKRSFYVRSFLGVSGFARNGYAWKQDNESSNQLYENTLSYDTRINKLAISAVGGYSYQNFLNNGYTVQAGNFLTDASAEDFSSSLDFANGKATSTSYKNGSRLVAFFGRLNLNYDDIAFLSASLRREGSTQFGANHKWGMFPAVSAGLDISRMTEITGVNSLKVRASYGVTGALPGGSYYSLLLYGPTGATGNLFYYNGNYISAYGPTQNANPDLKWEKKAEFDAGLDFAGLNNRLTGTFDYYNRKTSDLIFNVTVPVPPFPTDKQYRNIGTLKSNGVELLLSYDVLRQKDFTWTTSVNFSTYHVVLASLNKDLAGNYVGASNLGTPGQEQTQITRAVEGMPVGLLWGPIYKGLDQNGKYQFSDGKGGVTASTDYKAKMGNGLPKFEFGWGNSFKYKHFDLNFFFRGAIGHDLINTYRAFYENPTVVNSYNVVKSKYYNPKITDGQIFSSLFVEKASYAKLDNATLGYTFNLPSGASFKSIRAYFTGQNLFVITGYTGVDPEVRYEDPATPPTPPNTLAPGIDRRETWVRTRSFTLGCNLKF